MHLIIYGCWFGHGQAFFYRRRDKITQANPTIAVYCMEAGVEHGIPTYSGGLGVLFGDMMRSAADLGLPIVGVTLQYNFGYFKQKFQNGHQTETYPRWDPSSKLEEVQETARMEIDGEDVTVRARKYTITGRKGTVPVYFLDTTGNLNGASKITDRLYAGDDKYRIEQEAVLGIGGPRILEAVGYDIHTNHMNEGHSAFLALELLKRYGSWEKVREACVFTTHSPNKDQGHDVFDYNTVKAVIGDVLTDDFPHNEWLSMTDLAMHASRFINGVSEEHGRVTRQMYPQRDIQYITNGVHPYSWTSIPFQELFDRRIPHWRNDPANLVYASSIPTEEIRQAHQAAKNSMVDHIREKTGVDFDAQRPIYGFARRVQEYKRHGLLFHDMDRLKEIAHTHGLQVVFAGKAHPRDEGSKNVIAHTNYSLQQLRDAGITAAYLPNYGMEDCLALTSGSDVWLNLPRAGQEASGTSGMVAAFNGVPQKGTKSGWWLEGCIEGKTGWFVGSNASDDDQDAQDLYRALDVVLPMFGTREMDGIMRSAIARNASYFNTQRSMKEYHEKAYKSC